MPVPLQASGWAYYKKAVTFPSDVQWIQLESGLDVSTTKAGEGGSAFDDVQLVQVASDSVAS